jgi:hypothetical protein
MTSSFQPEAISQEHERISLFQEEKEIPKQHILIELVAYINTLKKWQIIYLTIIILMIITAGYVLYEILINRYLRTM